MWMRLAVSSSLLAAWVVACGGSDSTTLDPTGDDPVITGVGGSSAMSSTTSGESVSSSTGSQGGAGGMGMGGATATSSTITSGSGGMPPVCNDAFSHESNESELTAHSLENEAIDECDSSGGSVQGVLAGPNDVDWFTYDGDDTFNLGCIVDPGREITQTQTGLRLCKFALCESGPANAINCGDATNATSPEGVPGCCHDAGFEFDLNCPGGFSDDSTVFIRIDQPGATASTCNEYTLNYHF